MREVGFSQVLPTHAGRDFAGRLFDRLPPADRPADLAAVDALLRDPVAVVATLPAPIDADPWITAGR